MYVLTEIHVLGASAARIHEGSQDLPVEVGWRMLVAARLLQGNQDWVGQRVENQRVSGPVVERAPNEEGSVDAAVPGPGKDLGPVRSELLRGVQEGRPQSQVDVDYLAFRQHETLRLLLKLKMQVLGWLENIIVLLLLAVRLVLRVLLILLVVSCFERVFSSGVNVLVTGVGVLLRSKHLTGDGFGF